MKEIQLIICETHHINRRFPSCLSPLYQSESQCEGFHLEISFIHLQSLVHLHVNKTNFHMKGFTLGLALKQWRKATRKSPIRQSASIYFKSSCFNSSMTWWRHLTTSTRMLWGQLLYSAFVLLLRIARAWHKSALQRLQQNALCATFPDCKKRSNCKKHYAHKNVLKQKQTNKQQKQIRNKAAPCVAMYVFAVPSKLWNKKSYLITINYNIH